MLIIHLVSIYLTIFGEILGGIAYFGLFGNKIFQMFLNFYLYGHV